MEAISNARKHAYGETEGGLIKVRFAVARDEVILEIADEGRGEAEDMPQAGVGRTLMSAFARQLRGRAEIGPAETGGMVARLIFPAPEALPDAPPPPPPSGRDADSNGNHAAA